jgi:hypothetical protein
MNVQWARRRSEGQGAANLKMRALRFIATIGCTVDVVIGVRVLDK